MNKKEAQQLLVNYAENTATQEERRLVERYFLEYLENSHQLPDHVAIESASVEMWDNLQLHMGVTKKPAIRLWPRIIVAASLIVVLGAGLFFGLKYFMSDTQGVVLVNNQDILPGKNMATLTTEGGRTLQLISDKTGVVIAASALKYNDGTAVERAKTTNRLLANERLTATTPRGGAYQITLADGTHVWLNAASSISFPAQFNGRERRVELTGEAYFEVAKAYKYGVRLPFVVVSGKQAVEVLGTHFNINNYMEEGQAKITLLEGLVRVGTVTLQPNQQAVQTNNGYLIRQVNAEESVAWKNGYFDFNEEKLESIMNKIARWYDVTVVYETLALKEQTFTGNISKFSKVSEVLKKLALSKVLRFKVEGKKIIVTD